MRAVTIERNYGVGDKFNIFFCGDLHIDSPEHDRKLLIRDLDEAVSNNSRIVILGDIFDFIMNGDSKRYTPSRAKYGHEDSHINYAIDEAFNVLSAYAKNIDVMMLGNHESSVIKHHGIDPVAILVNRLNRESEGNIKYLGYNGYIRYIYRYKNGSFMKTYIIKAVHGMGGSSPVTKGTITINRLMNMHEADLYVMGHTHQAVVLPSEHKSYVCNSGEIKVKERKAITVGAYVKPVSNESCINTTGANPYNVQFGDLMRSLQSTKGITVQNNWTSKEEMVTRIIS